MEMRRPPNRSGEPLPPPTSDPGRPEATFVPRHRGTDEEDIVQNAFHSFFQGVANGRFLSQLDDRDNLWRLLVVITARKCCS